MKEKSLSWTITPSERRCQIKKFISIAWIPLTGLVVFSCFEYVSNFVSWTLRDGIEKAIVNVISMVVGVLIMIFLFFIVNLIFPYKKRSYILNREGIKIAKGRKERFFLWNDFDFFYSYRMIRLGPEDKDFFREGLSKAGDSLEGKIFYLKKKAVGPFSKLYKVFVIVYSEKDNSDKVLKFLSLKLQRKQMKPDSDLGLVSYKFK